MMFCVSSISGAGVLLLLPTTFLWLAVAAERFFGYERALELIARKASDTTFIALALLLPFAVISLGLWAWRGTGCLAGLIEAGLAAIFLVLTLCATLARRP